jgi:signal transduction histidine kinase
MMSVGGLAAGMAHEINNPMGGILMGAQNLLRRISPAIKKNKEVARECGTTIEKINKYMEKRQLIKMLDGIREMGGRAARIVSNMLSFSRRSDSKKLPVDLKKLIDKTVELASNDYDLKKKYDFKHIEIKKEFDEDLPRVYCIGTEIEQVILNLVKNAAQAMMGTDKGSKAPGITFRLKNLGDLVQMEVEDSGPGIGAEECKRVFEPFYTTKQVGEGTGLGLSVSYFIVTDNHHGEMSIDSVPGQYSRFIIKLPVKGD